MDVSDTSGDDASALSTANVAAQPFPLIVNAISGEPDELLPSTGIVASFISSDGASAADLSALINWGDGQTTIGSILQALDRTLSASSGVIHTQPQAPSQPS